MGERRPVLRVVRPVIAQQSEDQAGQLARREHQGPPMGELGALGGLLGIVGRAAGVMLPHAVGGFHEVVPEIGIDGASQGAILAGQLPGLRHRPGEAGEPGQLVIRGEGANVADFCEEAGPRPGTVRKRVVVTAGSWAMRWSTVRIWPIRYRMSCTVQLRIWCTGFFNTGGRRYDSRADRWTAWATAASGSAWAQGGHSLFLDRTSPSDSANPPALFLSGRCTIFNAGAGAGGAAVRCSTWPFGIPQELSVPQHLMHHDFLVLALDLKRRPRLGFHHRVDRVLGALANEDGVGMVMRQPLDA